MIGIEEATTLSSRKHQDITTCCRTSKPNWRPRIYSTTNPGRDWACVVSDEVRAAVSGEAGDGDAVRAGAGERQRVQQPGVSAGAGGPERLAAAGLAGWGLGHGGRAVLHDVPAGGACGRRISTRPGRGSGSAALDYGFTHYTVVLLGCTDGDGNVFVVDEHAERLWLPQRHAAAIKAMLARHRS